MNLHIGEPFMECECMCFKYIEIIEPINCEADRDYIKRTL